MCKNPDIKSTLNFIENGAYYTILLEQFTVCVCAWCQPTSYSCCFSAFFFMENFRHKTCEIKEKKPT